jgi:hypothetical protein
MQKHVCTLAHARMHTRNHTHVDYHMRTLSNYISGRVIVGFLWNVHDLTYPTWLTAHVQAYARLTFSEEVKLSAGRFHCHGV